MSIQVRKSSDRGSTKISWLNSKHTFSFGDYHDNNFVRFGALRVINEDIVAPGSGFGTHSHRDMEILTIVLSGELEHKDSMGNGSVLEAGSIQRMTAGTGVQHSEWNHSKENPVHFLQIWIVPESTGLPPSYEEKICGKLEDNQWQIIASKSENAGVLVHQDVVLSRASLNGTGSLPLAILPTRMAWLHIVDGNCSIDGNILSAGDAAYFREPQSKVIQTNDGVKLLWFDLAAQF